MDFELPSLPKAVVLNFALIAAIGLAALIGMVWFWQLLPLMMDITGEEQPSALNVDFTYMRDAEAGADWAINGSASNPSNESLSDIKVRVFSDDNVQGTAYTIMELAPGESENFTLLVHIKSSAARGPQTVQTVVQVPGTLPAEYPLDLTIGG